MGSTWERRKTRIGYDYVHSAIDDYSRVDQNAASCPHPSRGGCYGHKRRTQPVLADNVVARDYAHVLSVGDSIHIDGYDIQVLDRRQDHFHIQITTTTSTVAVASHSVYGSDERSRAQIAHADTAFRAAGLGLPNLEIHVHENFTGCDGWAGLFNRDGSGTRVDLCSGTQFTVLHEFAHAWEYRHVDDSARDEFLKLHGLDAWRGHQIPWARRGAEVAAETVAKGLLDRALPEWQCGEALVLDAGFSILTGYRSPRFADAVVGRGDDLCVDPG
jgi:hypothetical protein